ncbi:MAG: HugZ family protein [Chromatiaceae bacterium]|nr:MAG: HugZ family protein [Chromatiaceae bacterium]
MASPPESSDRNAPSPPDLQQVYAELQQFRTSFATLLMATSNSAGEPDASYAAYIEEDGDFYCFLSELSIHTRNLRERPRVSALFIENEASAGHLFARRRLIFTCEVEEVARDSTRCEALLDRFAGQFGALIATLRGLDDFHLFRLRPRHARYVSGFAKAFVIDDVALAEIRHLRDQGHRRRASAG